MALNFGTDLIPTSGATRYLGASNNPWTIYGPSSTTATASNDYLVTIGSDNKFKRSTIALNTTNPSKFLREDGTWQTVSSGGGSSNVVQDGNQDGCAYTGNGETIYVYWWRVGNLCSVTLSGYVGESNSEITYTTSANATLAPPTPLFATTITPMQSGSNYIKYIKDSSAAGQFKVKNNNSITNFTFTYACI